MYIAATFK